MITIPLTRGMVAIVDDEDAHLAALQWRARKDGRTYYAVRNLPFARRLSLHRAVMGVPLGAHVDHVNGDGLDCRRANLRAATADQNQANARKRKDNTSGFKGVARHEGRWRAQIVVGGVSRWLGRFATAEDAARAYDAAAREAFGPFAAVNFPVDAERAA